MNRSTRLTLLALVLLTPVSLRLGATPQTWTGKISDSMCMADHRAMAAGKSEHDCALECIKAGNQFVFVNEADKKIFKIANQKLAALTTLVGTDHALVTGELKGDMITVTKIAGPKGK
jgi:hypothetical protein